MTGKRLKKAYEAVEKKVYDLDEAVALVKAGATAKFDETVEISVHLGVDPKQSDQMVRGAVTLPAGTGKTLRVAVFAKGPKATEAKNAGADIVGDDDLMNDILAGKIDFGRLIATPDMMPALVMVSSNGEEKTYQVDNADLIDSSVITIDFSAKNTAEKKLDLMFTIDTTGSMGDEIIYLQKELEDVIRRVQADCDNIPVRLSVNFYRDMEDDYVVRPYEFTSDINSALALLNKEYADGGGDYEEAVELALQSSVFDHSWDSDSIKLMFLVLDAPPHNTQTIKESLIKSIQKASEMGIRIIPVASSGVDKDTEFLLRSFAMTTGGTYTFLTNDSGIGGDHIEPTIGEYQVEQLNDLLVRVIEEYIK